MMLHIHPPFYNASPPYPTGCAAGRCKTAHGLEQVKLMQIVLARRGWRMGRRRLWGWRGCLWGLSCGHCALCRVLQKAGFAGSWAPRSSSLSIISSLRGCCCCCCCCCSNSEAQCPQVSSTLQGSDNKLRSQWLLLRQSIPFPRCNKFRDGRLRLTVSGVNYVTSP